MAKDVRWSGAARRSLNAALDWLFARNPKASEKLRLDVDRATQLLASTSGLGQRVRGDPTARSYLLTKWKKRILFRETDDAILVVAFRDQRRRNAVRAP